MGHPRAIQRRSWSRFVAHASLTPEKNFCAPPHSCQIYVYPMQLRVRYEWTEVVEHDVESGLIVLFGVTLILALG